ncbi:uncharacterized protein H6S33_002145 [Morchella sextelata]|uniref:uncharacterized protein n=1 Tax=Morchella sextelata TaxID=1174677 RepID=UPI001D04798F|nr:uncharacterized protein H6S33_002145 [Morchella sextelata]KAH0608093.1 hypothetical protein H6S33_002145 [Morchella sextelata]
MPTSLTDPSLLTLFQAAPPTTRQAFLHSLAPHFHPADWHNLHTLLTAHSYHVDLLPLLPLEITLQILRLLPLHELVLARRVSRRWNTLLRSPDVCRSLTRHFFPANTETHVQGPAHLFENLASRRLAFLRHRPAAVEELVADPAERSLDDEFSVDIDFERCRMAVWMRGENSIVVRDLLCGASGPAVLPRSYMDDHGQIDEGSLSGAVVAAVSTTMGVCQVWELATGDTHSFRLPGAEVAAMHSDGHVTGILLHRRNLEYQLVVHSAAARRTRCIDIACGEQYNGNQLIVHEASNRVVHMRYFVDGKLDIELASWSIDTGKFIEKSTLRVPTQNEVRRFWPVGNGRWVMHANLGYNADSISTMRRELDLTKPGLNIVAKPYEVSISKVFPEVEEHFGGFWLKELGTSGSMAWTLTSTALNDDLITGLIWEEGNLEARAIDFPPFRAENSTILGDKQFAPYYFDPYNRFALWGYCPSNSEPLEVGVPDRCGFESCVLIVERYYGIHEQPEKVPGVAI